MDVYVYVANVADDHELIVKLE